MEITKPFIYKEHFSYSESIPSFDIKNILCVGSGYVGILTMSVLANQYPGIKIKIYDKNRNILDRWIKAGNELREYEEQIKEIENEGSQLDKKCFKIKPQLPIVERNLEKIYLDHFNKNIFFTDELSDEDLLLTDVIFICVNTPSTTLTKIKSNITIEELKNEINRGIGLDMTNVFSSIGEICEKILNSKDEKSVFKERILIQKSTVPIETLKSLHVNITQYLIKNLQRLNEIVKEPLNESEVEDFVLKYFKLVNIPEFLAEGSAVTNLMSPDRVVIGYMIESLHSKFAATVIKCFYEKWVEKEKIILLDSNSSELTKLVSNALLGQRISSINSITELCEQTNANVNKVSESVGMDSRIGKNYLKASMGFGGSCLKKDILSLIYILSSRGLDLQAEYWSQVVLMNEYQRLRIAKMILNQANKIIYKTVTIFGLSFKGNTNDTRGSNAIFLISYLINNDINVNLYDPLVTKKDIENELKLYEMREWDDFEDLEHIKYFHDYKDSLENSSVLVFCNNHSFFADFNLDELASCMIDNSSVFDLYDIFNEDKLKKTEFKVFKLGVHSDLNTTGDKII